jgi:hypothetical protein
MSPQGVVFASTTPEYVGMLEGVSTPERIKAIRDLKQFGPMFEKTDPKPLPLMAAEGIQTLEGRRFAVGTAPVLWNDLSGDWSLLVLEDLANSVPREQAALQGMGTSVLVVLLGWMWMHLLRGRRAQEEATVQLRAFAAQQAESVVFRSRLAQAAVRLQHCESLKEAARVFLLEAREMLGAVQGVVYVVPSDASANLRLLCSTASGESPPATLALGEGLLGQCAKERRSQLLVTPPQGFWTVRSGLGSTQPAALLLAPLVLHESLIGVVELALLHVPQDGAQSQLDEMVALLANSLEILRRNPMLKTFDHTDGELALAESS